LICYAHTLYAAAAAAAAGVAAALKKEGGGRGRQRDGRECVCAVRVARGAA
jgi:hypothetical protein